MARALARRVADPLLRARSVRPNGSLFLGVRSASCVPVDDEIGGLTDDQKKVNVSVCNYRHYVAQSGCTVVSMDSIE